MNLACHKLGVFAIAFAAIALPSPGAPVNLGLSTGQFNASPSEVNVEFYDGSALFLGSILSSATSNGSVTNISVSTDLPPGHYSFAIDGFAGKRWTSLINVSSEGVSSSIGSEAFPLAAVPQDSTEPISGNLLVEGSIDMRGRVFNLGVNPSDENLPAFSLRTDLNGANLFNSSTSTSPFWYWGIAYDGNQFRSLMRLEGNLNGNDEALYVGDSRVLTAANASSLFTASRLSIGTGVSASGANSFAAGNTVTASGTHSGAFGQGTTAQGYNQFVVGQFNALLGTSGVNTNSDDPLFIVGNGVNNGARSNAFVVERDGDTRIQGRLTAGNFASVQPFAVAAIGDSAIAGSQDAVAIGFVARAMALGSVALGGFARAFGEDSSALGTNSIALGNDSIALGPFAISTGNNSLAFGRGTGAEGAASVALGASVNAKAKNQVVLGRFNAPSGDPAAETPQDDLFIVGNGTDSANRSNAVTVKKNAATAIGTGVVTTTASQTVVGKFNDTSLDAGGKDHGSGLFIVGMGSGTGTTPRKNALRVRVDGTLLVRPAGDLSMGDFQTGEQP
jgi:YadA head domain repeat (2 copies)